MSDSWDGFAIDTFLTVVFTIQCVKSWRGGGSLVHGKTPDLIYANSQMNRRLGTVVIFGPIVFGSLDLLLLTHEAIESWHDSVARLLLYVIYYAEWALFAGGVLMNFYVYSKGKPKFLIPPQYRSR